MEKAFFAAALEVFAGGGAASGRFGTTSDLPTKDSSAGGDMNLHVASVIAARTTLLMNLVRLFMKLIWFGLLYRLACPRNRSDASFDLWNAGAPVG